MTASSARMRSSQLRRRASLLMGFRPSTHVEQLLRPLPDAVLSVLAKVRAAAVSPSFYASMGHERKHCRPSTQLGHESE